MGTGDSPLVHSGQDYEIDPRCHYTREHLWVRLENDLATIGVSDLLRAQVGGGHMLDVKPVGTTPARGDELAGWVVSKAVVSPPRPVDRIVVEADDLLAARPDMDCSSPYGAGWIVKLAPGNWDKERAFLIWPDPHLTLRSWRGAM